MIRNRTMGVGGLLMLLVIGLAAIGIAYALWSKVLVIQGVVRTGDVDAVFVKAFTDDDDAVDNTAKDSQDTGDCPISVGPDLSPFGNDKDPNDGITSCDPAETGRDPKKHYDKDVARCDAIITPDPETALVAILNAYPSYHCTAWFDLNNTGTIPILFHGVLINGLVVANCESGASTPMDLTGDGLADVEICVSEVLTATGQEEQCDPGPTAGAVDDCQFDLDIHVLQDAPQNGGFTFSAEACVHQWNEEPPAGSGFCGPNPEHAPPGP